MSYKVSMVCLGCAKNRVDGELLLYKLYEAGYEIIEDVGLCDIAIVNTCGFIQSAKEESIEEILELATLKKEKQIKHIVITGCLAQRYQEEIMKELYEVDAVIGIGANSDIVDVVNRCVNGEKVELFPDKNLLPLSGGRIQTTPFHYAYLKIADGCNNRCSFCAIPLIRGRYKSKEMDLIIEEAKWLAGNGVTEIILVAQDTTKYGKDIYGEYRIVELLKELCKIDNLKWIRLLYCYPETITDELLEVMAQEEKIVNYIDLPIQHCSKNILTNMNRRGDKESLLELLNKIRKIVPNITLRTSLIAGFPNESEDDFVELCEFVKEAKFERLGCFAYSMEEGTKACEFENQIDEEVKLKRQEIIMEHQRQIAEKYCEDLNGKTLTVVVEGYDRYAKCYFGRSEMDAPEVDGKVFFMSPDKKLSMGEYVQVLIDDFIDLDPIGQVINNV